MRELRLLELLIFFLLALPFVRPFVKKLWPLHGMVWLEVIALFTVICLFPGYGFRPECIPLLLAAIFLNIVNFCEFAKLSNNNLSFHNPRISPVITIGIALITTGIALYFSPLQDTSLNADVKTVTLEDEYRQTEFVVRIYENIAAQNAAPSGLVLMIPPLQSISAIDKVCVEIAKRGFMVITYSKPQPLWEKFKALYALKNGTVSETANRIGRLFEDDRLEDIEFLLSQIDRIGQSASLTFTDKLVLAGYDAGGSGAIMLSSSEAFAENNPAVKGIIAIEGRLWSLYRRDKNSEEASINDRERQSAEPLPEQPDTEDTLRLDILSLQKIQKIWHITTKWVKNRLPKKTNIVSPAPHMQIPALLLTSDRITDPVQRDGPYVALLSTLHNAVSPAMLLAVRGAGPLDYTDYPITQPLYSALIRGKERRLWTRGEYVSNTAEIIADFASSLFEEKPFEPSGEFFVETNRAWN
jgi:hypothetical protein